MNIQIPLKLYRNFFAEFSFNSKNIISLCDIYYTYKDAYLKSNLPIKKRVISLASKCI